MKLSPGARIGTERDGMMLFRVTHDWCGTPAPEGSDVLFLVSIHPYSSSARKSLKPDCPHKTVFHIEKAITELAQKILNHQIKKYGEVGHVCPCVGRIEE